MEQCCGNFSTKKNDQREQIPIFSCFNLLSEPLNYFSSLKMKSIAKSSSCTPTRQTRSNVRRKLAIFMGFLRVLCDWKCYFEKTYLFTFAGIFELYIMHCCHGLQYALLLRVFRVPLSLCCLQFFKFSLSI